MSKHRMKLPDGTWMPLEYELPEACVCKVGDPRHCQHAEGMRSVGFRDPKVLPNDELAITAVYGDFRLLFLVNAEAVTSIGRFDSEAAEPAGQTYVLPRPKLVERIRRRANTTRKKRRDAGMAKEDADRMFNRIPGATAGRRAHTRKFATV